LVEKERLNLVFIGHVDHGKSTLVGQLLLTTGNIKQQKIDRYEKLAAEKGKESFKYAWTMDTKPEERERGLTIDPTHWNFETKNKNIFIIDAPGHSDFIKNMITGASEADAGILLVAADDGIMPQTEEHAILAMTMGVEQLIIAVNKVDLIDYNREAYNSLVGKIEKFLKTVGWSPTSYSIVPVSAFNDDNITKRSEKLKWYKGPTFIEAINKLKSTRKKVDKPFRFPIDDKYKISGIGTVVAGVISSGKVKVGDKVIINPQGIKTEIRSIEEFHKSINKASAGSDVGMNIKGVDLNSVQRGNVLGLIDNPPSVAKEFKARVIIFNHPKGVYEGYTPILHINTEQVPGMFVKMLSKIDQKTGEVIEEEPTYLQNGDVANVLIKPMRPIVIEESEFFPRLSRFAIRDIGKAIGAGMCLKITQ